MKTSSNARERQTSRNAKLIAAWRLWRGRPRRPLLISYDSIVPLTTVNRRRAPLRKLAFIMPGARKHSPPRKGLNALLIESWRLWRGLPAQQPLLLTHQSTVPLVEVNRRRAVFKAPGLAGLLRGVFSFTTGELYRAED